MSKQLWISSVDAKNVNDLLGYDVFDVKSELSKRISDVSGLYNAQNNMMVSYLKSNLDLPKNLVIVRPSSYITNIEDSWCTDVKYSYKTKRGVKNICMPYLYSDKKKVMNSFMKCIGEGSAKYSIIEGINGEDKPHGFDETSGKSLEIILGDKNKTSVVIGIPDYSKYLGLIKENNYEFSVFGWNREYFGNNVLKFFGNGEVNMQEDIGLDYFLAREFERSDKILLVGDGNEKIFVDELIPDLKINYIDTDIVEPN